MRAVRDTERNTEGIGGALSAGVTGENSPHYTNQPTKNKNRPGTSENIFVGTRLPERSTKLWSLDESPKGRISVGKRSSCFGCIRPMFGRCRRSLSSRRWIRCRMATAEWPLRRASSGQEMPSSLNCVNSPVLREKAILYVDSCQETAEARYRRWEGSSRNGPWNARSEFRPVRSERDAGLMNGPSECGAPIIRAMVNARCEWRERNSLE